MEKHSSSLTIESKTHPGVRFTVRKINVRRRLKFNESMSAYNEKLKVIRLKRQPLDAEYRAALEGVEASKKANPEAPIKMEMPDDRFSEFLRLIDEESMLDAGEMTPAMVRYGLIGTIEGIQIDDIENPDADALIEAGPDDLYKEIANAIAHEFGIDPPATENLGSGSTSVAVDDGTKTSGSADPAEKPDTITAEAA